MRSELNKYILYADDDMDDQQTLKDTLQEIAPEISLVLVENGLELLDFLKGHPIYKKLPVIIFSTADNHLWHQAARELGADDYVKKPVIYKKLKQVATQFADHCELVPPVKE